MTVQHGFKPESQTSSDNPCSSSTENCRVDDCRHSVMIKEPVLRKPTPPDHTSTLPNVVGGLCPPGISKRLIKSNQLAAGSADATSPPIKDLETSSSPTESLSTRSQSPLSSEAADRDMVLESDSSSGNESDDTFGVKRPRIRGLSLSRASLRPSSVQSYRRWQRRGSDSSLSSSSGRSSCFGKSDEESEDDQYDY